MTTKPTPPVALTWRGVTARRMVRHALAEPAAGLSPADIVGALCGAHAQVLSAAELSIGRRIAGATRSDVQRALWQERTLVKTFGPRGTIHLLAAADLPVWTGALQALPSPAPTHPDGVRFTPGQAEEVIAAIDAALADAELTVDQLTEAGQPRERLYPGAAATRALTPAGQAGNYPVLLVDGVVGGVWHQRRSGRKLAITVEPLRELTAAQRRQLDDEVDLLGAVMEAPATLTVGPVTVGAHA
jgi:winged helix DNA-binding protein